MGRPFALDGDCHGRAVAGAAESAKIGMENLDRYIAIVLDVVREVDRGHAALTELTLDRVAVRERRVQPSRGFSRGP
jgi:hypothetical protein